MKIEIDSLQYVIEKIESVIEITAYKALQTHSQFKINLEVTNLSNSYKKQIKLIEKSSGKPLFTLTGKIYEIESETISLIHQDLNYIKRDSLFYNLDKNLENLNKSLKLNENLLNYIIETAFDENDFKVYLWDYRQGNTRVLKYKTK